MTGEPALPGARPAASSTPAATACSAAPRFGSAYFQDHVPVREATEVDGPRGARSSTSPPGVTDVSPRDRRRRAARRAAARSGDGHGRAQDLPHRRARLAPPDEAFGDPYELPPDRAYGETCAAIASVQWNWRMLLRHRRGALRRPASSARSTTASSPASRSTARGYFYVNPLHLRDGHATRRARAVRRQPWFACACCPPNVMRLVASLAPATSPPATTAASSSTSTRRAGAALGGGRVALTVATDYPWDGRVEIDVDATRRAPWTLALRVPGWARRRAAAVDGAPVEPPARGYARARAGLGGRRHASTLELPMPPRLITRRTRASTPCAAASRSSAARSSTASSRPTRPPALVDDLRIDPAAELRAVPQPDLLGGIVTVEAAGAHEPPDGPPSNPRRGHAARDPVLALGQPRRGRDARLDPSAHAVVAPARARAGRRRGAPARAGRRPPRAGPRRRAGA